MKATVSEFKRKIFGSPESPPHRQPQSSVCGEEGLRGHEEHLHLLGELVAGVLPVIKS